MHFIKLIFVLCLSFLSVVSDFVLPEWSDNYHVKATLTVPESNFVQPLEFWYYKDVGKSRVDFHNGLVKSYQVANEFDLIGMEYKIFWYNDKKGSKTNKQMCVKTVGTAQLPISLQPAIYPIEDMFEYEGKKMYNGHLLHKYTRGEDPIGQFYRLRFTFYVNCTREDSWFFKPKCQPIRLEMEGKNLLFSSHTDNYYIDYHLYEPDVVYEETTTMNFPTCHNLHDLINDNILHSSTSISGFFPSLSTIVKQDRGFKDFTKKNGFIFPNQKEFRKRFSNFKQQLRSKKSKKHYNEKLKTFLDLTKTNLSAYNKRLQSRRLTNKKNRRKMNALAIVEYFTYTDDDLKLLSNYTYYNLHEEGMMNPVQSQLNCASCWAFAVTAVLEGTYLKKYGGTPIKLSEQALIDCSWGFNNLGCYGGSELNALEWIKDLQGIPLQNNYGPYKAVNGRCGKKDEVLELVRVNSYKRIKPRDYKGIQIALIKNGPVLAAMDSRFESLQKYERGLYIEKQCSRTAQDLEHTVVIVGFGYQNDQLYWIVRNSWSSRWGMNGHFLVSAFRNSCGLATSAVMVTVE